MIRHQLTDEQWEIIESLFPPAATTGRPRSDLRLVVGGILWILNTGSAWRDLPEDFGPWQTIYHHFNRWTSDGTLEQILLTLQQAMHAAGQIDHDLWCIDGTTVRAHRCAAGGGKKGSPESQPITL